MSSQYEYTDVMTVINSNTLGLHAIHLYYDEADPHSAVGSLQKLTRSKGMTDSETCLGVNCQLEIAWSSPEGCLWLVDVDGNVFTISDISFSNPPSHRLEYNGNSVLEWNVGQVFNLGQLNDIWGVSDNDVWITSFSGPAFHWNGSQWSEYRLPKAPTAIHGSATNDVYVVGYEGNIHYWNGKKWLKLDLPEGVRGNEPFTDVRVVNKDLVYITGRGGVLLRGSAASGFVNIGSSKYSWYGVGMLNERVFLAGGVKGIFELINGKFICLKDKGHPVAVCEVDKSICFIPADQKSNPWYINYEPGADRDWSKVNT